MSEKLRKAKELLASGTLSSEVADELREAIQLEFGSQEDPATETPEVAPAQEAAAVDPTQPPSFLSYEDPAPALGPMEQIGEFFGFGPQTMEDDPVLSGPIDAPPTRGGKDIEAEIARDEELAKAGGKKQPSYHRPTEFVPEKPAGMAPPQVGFTPFMGGELVGGLETPRSYYHQEPNYERAVKFWERVGRDRHEKAKALEDLARHRDKLGDSEYYNKCADILWKEAYDTHVLTNEPAYRPRKMDPSDASLALSKLYGKLAPYGRSMAAGIDSLLSMTLGRQASGALPTTEGEQILIDKGWLPQIPDKVSEDVENHPISFGAGALLSIFPAAKVNPAVKLMMPALRYAKKGATTGAKIGRGVVAGAPSAFGIGVAKETITTEGEKFRGIEMTPWEQESRILAEGGVETIGEMVGAPTAELAGATAKAAYQWLRKHPIIGNHLKGIRIGGGGGVVKPDDYADYEKAADELGDPASQAAPIIAEAPDAPIEDLSKKVLEVSDDFVKRAYRDMGRENEWWYKMFERGRPPVTADPAPLLRSIEELAQRKTGKELTVKDMFQLDKVLAEEAIPSVENSRVARIYSVLKDKGRVTPRQLDDAILEIDYQMSQVVPGTKAAPAMKVVQKGLRKVRDQFGPAYGDMKKLHHYKWKEIKGLKSELGVKGMDIDPTDTDQQEAVAKMLRAGRGPLKKQRSRLQGFRGEDPELEAMYRKAGGAYGRRELEKEMARAGGAHYLLRKGLAPFDSFFHKGTKLIGEGPRVGLIPGSVLPSVTAGSAAEIRARDMGRISQEEIDEARRDLFGRERE